MSYEIVALPEFSKNLKRISKKYKQVKKDILTLVDELKTNPKAGVQLANNCYKIRLANSSVLTGKSGGFRVIYYYLDNQNNIYLMSIYSKSDQATIKDEKILEILKDNNLC